VAGAAGSTGAAGPANTLSIGTVSSGATAAATITGAAPSQTLNLVLPKGDTGSAGVAGATGSVGPQGPPGSAASATTSASDLTSGTVATARLGSGTANSTTYLRGDQTYVTLDDDQNILANQIFG
jgi:hypothetical protein